MICILPLDGDQTLVIYLLGIMPLLKNRVLPLSTSSVRYIARNIEQYWKEEWDPELKRITKLSDAIMFKIRKELNKTAIGHNCIFRALYQVDNSMYFFSAPLS